MTEKREVWVFIEQEEGKVAPVSLELLGKARELAQKLGDSVSALLFGHDIGGLSEQAIHYGADRVLLRFDDGPVRLRAHARALVHGGRSHCDDGR